MELVNLNDHDTQNRQTSGSHGSIGWPRFRSFQRYSLAICLLEALAMALIVGYLLLNSSPQLQLTPTATKTTGGAPSVKIYRNDLNNVSLMVDLVEGCNQKLHDVPFDIECVSSKLELCPTLEGDVSSGHNYGARVTNNMANIVVTSKAGDRMKSSWVPLTRFSCKPNSQQQDFCRYRTVLQVDTLKEQQKILGWGGAMTDSSINTILSLNTNGTKRLLDDYFGDDGIRMNMVRITIGGSDFSSRFYTNLDNPSVEPEFQLMEEDILYKIPMLSYIQEQYGNKRPLLFFASMWSPPNWMKTNDHFNKGYLKGYDQVEPGRSVFQDTYYKKLAKLKKDFLLAYKNHSIEFWGLTVMNEPIFAVQPFLNFNTMIFPMEDYSRYVADYLGPTIKGDSQLKNIKLMAHDDNRRYLKQYTDEILKNERVRYYIDGVSTHGYIDEDYHLMKEIYLKHNGKNKRLFVLPTELCSGHLPFMDKATLGNWYRGIHYGIDIIKGLQHSAAGWVDWNMALDMTGGPGWLGGKLDSPVIVDKTNDVYHKSPMFYVMGQFSRYIPPDSVKLETTITNSNYDSQFETVTFRRSRGSDQLITVILNNNPYSIDLYLKLVGNRPENSHDTFFVKCIPDSVTTVIYSESLDSQKNNLVQPNTS